MTSTTIDEAMTQPKTNIKVWDSETEQETMIYDSYDNLYNRLYEEYEFSEGFWVADESEEWIRDKIKGRFWVVEEDYKAGDKNDWLANVSDRPQKRVVLFKNAKDAILFKMTWV